VSTVITGASRVEQVKEHTAAVDVLATPDDGVCERLERAF
jgi:hypothetical protein